MSLQTSRSDIYLASDGPMLQVVPGRSAAEALTLATELSEGVQLMLERLRDDLGSTDGGELFCAEFTALALLAETVGALTRSVNWNIKQGGDA